MKVLRCEPSDPRMAVIFSREEICAGWVNVYDRFVGQCRDVRWPPTWDDPTLLYRIRVIPKVKADENG